MDSDAVSAKETEGETSEKGEKPREWNVLEIQLKKLSQVRGDINYINCKEVKQNDRWALVIGFSSMEVIGGLNKSDCSWRPEANTV